MAAFQRCIQLLEKRAGKASGSSPAAETGKPIRFVDKGLRSLRTRLGLSAGDLARLLVVSEQSVYGWEAKKSTPRHAQVLAIAALRGLGKREARSRQEQLTT